MPGWRGCSAAQSSPPRLPPRRPAPSVPATGALRISPAGRPSRTSAPSRRSAAATGPATAQSCPGWGRCCASCRPSSEAASPSHESAVRPRRTVRALRALIPESLQLAPDFGLDGLWQGFRVPTVGYVDRHTLRVQHVAMIVVLRGRVLHGLRGLLFGHRSGPGDELVTDHVRGQLLRRAAVRRDDPATLIPPRLLLPGHLNLQS